MTEAGGRRRWFWCREREIRVSEGNCEVCELYPSYCEDWKEGLVSDLT